MSQTLKVMSDQELSEATEKAMAEHGTLLLDEAAA